MGRPLRATGQLPIPHAWRVGTCPASLAGGSQGSHGTEQVKASCDHLGPRPGTWSGEVRSLPSAWASASWPPLPGQNRRPWPGQPAEQQGSGSPRLPPREEPPLELSANRTQKPEGPPASTAAPARGKPSCSLSSSGRHLVQGSKDGGSRGHLGGSTAALGQRPAAEKAPDDIRGWRSVRWDSEC